MPSSNLVGTVDISVSRRSVIGITDYNKLIFFIDRLIIVVMEMLDQDRL